MDLRNASHPGDTAPVPRSARLAGALLLVLGLANAGVGTWGLVAGADEISPTAAGGLVAAGAVTVGLGWYVRRGRPIAVYVALVVFELLLIPRLMTLGQPGAGAWASLVVLVCLVALLWAAAAAVRRGARRRVDGGHAGPAGSDAL